MLDLADEPSFIESQVNEAMKSASTSQRGKKALPLVWSRLIDIQNPAPPVVQSFSIDDDIADAFENAYYPPKRTRKKWQAIYHPKTYWKALDFKDIDDNKLGVKKLESYAIDASKVRKLFKDRACKFFLSS